MDKFQYQMEFDARLEEYRTLKLEIVSNLNAGRNVANLCLTALGLMIAASPSIITNNLSVIFLITPILFYGLAWTQLRYVYLVLDMGKYLHEVAIPGIKNTIESVSVRQKRQYNTLLQWDSPGKNPTILRKNKFLQFLFLPIAGANYGIPLLASILSLAAFFAVSERAGTLSITNTVLIVVDILGFLYSIYWGLQAEFRR